MIDSQGSTQPQRRFLPSFWVANGMELFERLALYGQGAVLSVFLRDHLHFSAVDAGTLSSIFGGLIYFLPIFAGAIADLIGFRRAFTIAFGGLAVGYFMVGSTGMQAFQSLYAGRDMFTVLVPMLVFTAMAGSFIKPSVLGTVAVTTTPESKSMGYAVYYWIVNIGAALGPSLAFLVRHRLGIEFVYCMSSLACAAMLVVNLAFYQEVRSREHDAQETVGQKLANLLLVLQNGRFMTFLLIFSLFWIMFWQTFIIIPFYVRDFISKDAPFELIESAGAWCIIVFQLLVNYLTRGLRPRTAVVVGFTIATCSWLIIAAHPTISTIVAAIAVFAIGEMTQAPRYYEYIAELAPPGQQGLFQGYAFLPIAIGWLVGGRLGGWLYTRLAEEARNPQAMWLVLFGVGVAATLLMLLYNQVVGQREDAEASGPPAA